MDKSAVDMCKLRQTTYDAMAGINRDGLSEPPVVIVPVGLRSLDECLRDLPDGLPVGTKLRFIFGPLPLSGLWYWAQ